MNVGDIYESVEARDKGRRVRVVDLIGNARVRVENVASGDRTQMWAWRLLTPGRFRLVVDGTAAVQVSDAGQGGGL